MVCEFQIIHQSGGDEIVDTISFPCDQELDADIFDSFDQTTTEFTDVDDAYGRYLVRMNENIDSYGEYKIRLNKVHYNYCAEENGEPASIKGVPFCRVCETNFTMTRPYLMQIGASSAFASDDLSDFYNMRGDRILTSSELDDIASVRYSDYDGGGDIDQLLTDFVDKYDALAVDADMSGVSSADSIAKVPGRNIFVVEGSIVYEHASSLGSATLIVRNGDVVVHGNVPDDLLLVVPDGTISFRDMDCERQMVRGIYIAGQ